MSSIVESIENYKELLERKDFLTDALKETNQLIEQARDQLVEAMLEDDVDSIQHGGFSYTITPRTRYSKKAGSDEELMEMLRDHGLGDIIKESVNAQTLQGAMSEEAKNNGGELPEEWAAVINQYTFNDISRRCKK